MGNNRDENTKGRKYETESEANLGPGYITAKGRLTFSSELIATSAKWET